MPRNFQKTNIRMFIKNFFTQNAMDGHTELFESLVEKTVDYGKTSLRLMKLRTLSKTSDIVSSLLSHLVVLVFVLSFMLFLSLGLAIWIGEILGKSWYGFLVVAAFYGLAGLLTHLFLHKWLKRMADDQFIKQVLK